MKPLFVAFAALLSVSALSAAAQSEGASMVNPPPATAASGTRPANPDNMPIKRPTPPPNSDRMLHNSPASDAIAK